MILFNMMKNEKDREEIEGVIDYSIIVEKRFTAWRRKNEEGDKRRESG